MTWKLLSSREYGKSGGERVELKVLRRCLKTLVGVGSDTHPQL